MAKDEAVYESYDNIKESSSVQMRCGGIVHLKPVWFC